MPAPINEGGRRRRLLFSVEEDASGLHVEAHVPPAPSGSEAGPVASPWPWRYLSRLTLRVVRLLAGRAGWLTREEIARELSVGPEGDLRPLLSDLAKRGVVESSPTRGYSLALPNDRKPDDFRAELLRWLAGEEERLPPE